jgi:hypothetical protein
VWVLFERTGEYLFTKISLKIVLNFWLVVHIFFIANMSVNVISSMLIPFFEGYNFTYWCTRMQTLLKSKDFWDIVQNGYVELDDINAFNALNDQQKREYKANIKKDNEALFFIQGAINQSIFPRINGAIHSQQAWKILNNAYQGAQTVKL